MSTTVEVDPHSLIEIIDAVNSDAVDAWDVASPEENEDAAQVWEDLAVALEGLIEIYGRLLIRYSGTSELVAEG